MANVRHILGISGGKDSAALAIYLKQQYPHLKIDYYNSDTGCELAETEVLIDRLSAYLGNITRLRAAEGSPEPSPFEHFLKAMGGFLPSPQQRWCTQKMKLAEFERYVGDDYAVSYVGIRGDEDRDGYISSKPNIQAVFPFRKNIWSIDVINKVLNNDNLKQLEEYYDELCQDIRKDEIMDPIIESIVADRGIEVIDSGAAVARRVEWLLDRYDIAASGDNTPTMRYMTFADEEYRKRLEHKAETIINRPETE